MSIWPDHARTAFPPAPRSSPSRRLTASNAASWAANRWMAAVHARAPIRRAPPPLARKITLCIRFPPTRGPRAAGNGERPSGPPTLPARAAAPVWLLALTPVPVFAVTSLQLCDLLRLGIALTGRGPGASIAVCKPPGKGCRAGLLQGRDSRMRRSASRNATLWTSDHQHRYRTYPRRLRRHRCRWWSNHCW